MISLASSTVAVATNSWRAFIALAIRSLEPSLPSSGMGVALEVEYDAAGGLQDVMTRVEAVRISPLAASDSW
jgi:hypothetical protein